MGVAARPCSRAGGISPLGAKNETVVTPRKGTTMDKAAFFHEARQDIPGPLAGVRVLEATTTWAGPMCGCLLADFGADVIKVELPEGEISRTIPPFLPETNPPISTMHATVNRNKRSLSLDLRKPEGSEIFLKL